MDVFTSSHLKTKNIPNKVRNFIHHSSSQDCTKQVVGLDFFNSESVV